MLSKPIMRTKHTHILCWLLALKDLDRQIVASQLDLEFNYTVLLQTSAAAAAAAAAKSSQWCPTRCNPIDGSPPGSAVPRIFQARTLELVAISFSNACKWKVKVKSLSPARLLAPPRTAAHKAPPSMGVSRQEYWSGVPSPSPVTLPQTTGY